MPKMSCPDHCYRGCCLLWVSAEIRQQVGTKSRRRARGCHFWCGSAAISCQHLVKAARVLSSAFVGVLFTAAAPSFYAQNGALIHAIIAAATPLFSPARSVTNSSGPPGNIVSIPRCHPSTPRQLFQEASFAVFTPTLI